MTSMSHKTQIPEAPLYHLRNPGNKQNAQEFKQKRKNDKEQIFSL